MERIKKDAPDSAEQSAQALRDGKVVILPTDTLYGFSALVSDVGESKIRAIKDRNDTKPFIRLIATPADIYQYTDICIAPPLFALWPAPLTLVVPLKADIAEREGTPSAAFRCPADAWLRRVIALAASPIYSTSVNRSGEAPFTQPDRMAAAFAASVALIVDAGVLPPAAASTIAALTAETCTVLRQGDILLPDGVLSYTGSHGN
jgi:L-threonylcarbamoyladenylate synthase